MERERIRVIKRTRLSGIHVYDKRYVDTVSSNDLLNGHKMCQTFFMSKR